MFTILLTAFFGSVSSAPLHRTASVAASGNTLPGGGFSQVSAKGNELWAITEHNQVVRWSGTCWEFKNHGSGTFVSASADGCAWLVNGFHPIDKNNVFRWDEKNSAWEDMGCWGFTVSGAGLHVSKDGRLYKMVDGKWDASGLKADNNLQAAIGTDGDVWRIDQNYVLYRFASGAWQQQTLSNGMGQPLYVDVNDSSRIVVTDNAATAWTFDGQTWKKVSSNCVQATIGSSAVYCLTASGQIQKVQIDETVGYAYNVQ